MTGKYEAVIGLEVHVELKTNAKAFCGCELSFGALPNSHVCPGCLGMPGAIPVLNRELVEYAIKTGLALNCQIAGYCRFDRKNYFYPDLPTNYQISQLDLPIASAGYLEIENEGVKKKIGINRVHMEEDAGKLVHQGSIMTTPYSLVDLNRAGTPLLEIVSEPDIRSPREAHMYMEKLRSILLFLGVSDCKMEEGSLRCDANISLKPEGSMVLGTKVEIKNLNSFRALERALEYEVSRQGMVLDRGGKIKQESRTWDERSGKTMPMRSKGDAPDYRYFPDPDLPPLRLDPAWVAQIKDTLPELPLERLHRLERDFGLSRYEATFLVNYPDFGQLFLELAAAGEDNTALVNLLMGDYARLAREHGHLAPQRIAELLTILQEGLITQNRSKAVLEELFRSPLSPREIVREKGWEVLRDSSQLGAVVQEVLAANGDLVARYRAGEEKLWGFFVGQVMRAAEGKADPKLVNELLREVLGKAD